MDDLSQPQFSQMLLENGRDMSETLLSYLYVAVKGFLTLTDNTSRLEKIQSCHKEPI